MHPQNAPRGSGNYSSVGRATGSMVEDRPAASPPRRRQPFRWIGISQPVSGPSHRDVDWETSFETHALLKESDPPGIREPRVSERNQPVEKPDAGSELAGKVLVNPRALV